MYLYGRGQHYVAVRGRSSPELSGGLRGARLITHGTVISHEGVRREHPLSEMQQARERCESPTYALKSSRGERREERGGYFKIP